MRPVALVTGISRRAGIGAAIAHRLAADGFDLYLTGWATHDADQSWGEDTDGIGAICTDAIGQGSDVEYAAADLADPDVPRQVITAAVERFGQVDVLVANHARSSDQDIRTVTAAELDLTFAVNARATLLLIQHYLQRLQGPGRVVLFTSGQYHGAMPGELPYIASKAVIHELTRSLAVDLAAQKVTVNCIDPGPNDTGYADDVLRQYIIDANPGGRWSTPQDAAKLVSWLVGPDADWVTGQTIASDGGWSAR